ncbi:MAG: copper amine oxidase N-terminal domain-containing protein, partial [Symbiobacteriaceae bacterium]|nr:copper amine oxidase N-terminal domain-containing protein [Symbiobacteriaceae bacterium]
IMVDDQAKTMDVAPQAINGRTQVPLRFAAENLGYDIAWEGTTNGITITTTVPLEVTINLPDSSTTPPPTQPAPEQSTTVTATQPVTSGGQGQVGALTAGIFSIMESETYHMKVYMEVEGESFTTDTYYKNGQMASLLEVDGMRAGWTIFKDITMYVIMEEEDLVMVMALDESLTAPDAYQDTEELVFIGSGTTEFNGKNSPYDEYRTADGTQIFYFVESSKLIGIRMIAEGETFDMIILAFDQEIPTWVFEVPSGMNMIDYAELLAGAFGW